MIFFKKNIISIPKIILINRDYGHDGSKNNF
jgi:hypothetical protein